MAPPTRTDDPAPNRRREILDLLRERGTAVEISEIAQTLGLHPNTVRFHLETLLGNRQVERTVAEPVGSGRPPQLFAAVRVMDPTGPRNYRLLAEVLVNGLAAAPHPQQQAIDAGRRWGSQQAGAARIPGADLTPEQGRSLAVDGLVRVLDDLDFAPEVGGDDGAPTQIGLRHCPFLDIADSRRDIVCPVHLGLMRGVLESIGSRTVTVDRLEAFVEPDLCVAHLAFADAS